MKKFHKSNIYKANNSTVFPLFSNKYYIKKRSIKNYFLKSVQNVVNRICFFINNF